LKPVSILEQKQNIIESIRSSHKQMLNSPEERQARKDRLTEESNTKFKKEEQRIKINLFKENPKMWVGANLLGALTKGKKSLV